MVLPILRSFFDTDNPQVFVWDTIAENELILMTFKFQGFAEQTNEPIITETLR